MEVLRDAEAVAWRAAELIASRVGTGDFHLAVSGGTTPRRMFERLARMDLPWERVHVWQVDERDAPDGDPARNLTMLVEAGLAARAILHPMPVGGDLEAGARAYAAEMARFGGLDLVHLGLGADGHTASLVPGDAALDAVGDVAVAGPYQGRRRLTLTFAALRRARSALWVVTGADKAPMLARLCAEDRSIVAARVDHPHARLLADAAAASEVHDVR